MLLPYSTDAPVYHFPWAVIGLIATNFVAFLITGGGNYHTHGSWVLEYGHINPLEWISCCFFHFGAGHLIGNMIFLWVYGLIVEGKIGWQRFLIVYFGIAIVHGLLHQTIMLGSDGISGGASAVIFGLGAMAVVWAPKNDIQTFFGFFLFYRQVDISILWFVSGYIVLEFFTIATRPFGMSSQILHLMGAGLGAGVGVYMLKRQLVDCENWDLFAVMKGTHGNQSWLDEKKGLTPGSGVVSTFTGKTPEEAAQEDQIKTNNSSRVKKLHRLIEQKKYMAALRALQQVRHFANEFQLDYKPLERLIGGLFKGRAWRDVVPLIEEHVRRFPKRAAPMRLKLAVVLIEIQERPRAGLNVLAEVDRTGMSEKQLSHLDSLTAAAQKMIDDGVFELEGRSW